MFVDLHIHTSLWKGFPREDGSTYLSVNEIKEIYNKYDVEQGVILPLMSPECRRKVQSNEEILQICNSDDMFVPFCNLDPHMLREKMRFMEYLEYYKDLGCKGVGEFTTNIELNNPLMEYLFSCMEELELPFLSHFSTVLDPINIYGIYDPNLKELNRLLWHFQNLTFIGHSKDFWGRLLDSENYRHLDNLFNAHPNLHGDLSANSGMSFLWANRPKTFEFLDKHQDQLHFGTDLCKLEIPPLCAFLLQARDDGNISQKVFNKISYENTLKLIR